MTKLFLKYVETEAKKAVPARASQSKPRIFRPGCKYGMVYQY